MNFTSAFVVLLAGIGYTSGSLYNPSPRRRFHMVFLCLRENPDQFRNFALHCMLHMKLSKVNIRILLHYQCYLQRSTLLTTLHLFVITTVYKLDHAVCSTVGLRCYFKHFVTLSVGSLTVHVVFGPGPFLSTTVNMKFAFKCRKDPAQFLSSAHGLNSQFTSLIHFLPKTLPFLYFAFTR